LKDREGSLGICLLTALFGGREKRRWFSVFRRRRRRWLRSPLGVVAPAAPRRRRQRLLRRRGARPGFPGPRRSHLPAAMLHFAVRARGLARSRWTAAFAGPTAQQAKQIDKHIGYLYGQSDPVPIKARTGVSRSCPWPEITLISHLLSIYLRTQEAI